MTQENAASIIESFATSHVLVIGDVMLDRFVYGSIERISPEAPIPVIHEDRTVDMPGGAGNVDRTEPGDQRHGHRMLHGYFPLPSGWRVADVRRQAARAASNGKPMTATHAAA